MVLIMSWATIRTISVGVFDAFRAAIMYLALGDVV